VSEVDLSEFQRKLAERRAKEQAALAEVTGNSFAADLVPEKDQRSEEDLELDRVIDKIDILQAYDAWCGKMKPVVHTGQTESIMISCPTPGHTDRDPSAWINLDKQTWFCGGCQLGGDAMDIAAYHFNYPVPGYKDGARFHDLRRDMAKSFGYTFHKLSDGKTYIGSPPETD
jgi:hypothetical protein